MVTSNVVGRAADRLADAVDSLFAGKPEPRKYSTAELLQSAAARKEHAVQQRASQKRDEALDHIREQLKKGEVLDYGAVAALSRSNLQEIKRGGDAGLESLIRRHEENLQHSFGIEARRTLERSRER